MVTYFTEKDSEDLVTDHHSELCIECVWIKILILCSYRKLYNYSL